MTIFGMTGAEIRMLERWCSMMRLQIEPVTEKAPFADLYEMRRQWLMAGGQLPVTEPQVLFLRARSNG